MFEHGGNFLPPYPREPGGNSRCLLLRILLRMCGCIHMNINNLRVTNQILFIWCEMTSVYAGLLMVAKCHPQCGKT